MSSMTENLLTKSYDYFQNLKSRIRKEVTKKCTLEVLSTPRGWMLRIKTPDDRPFQDIVRFVRDEKAPLEFKMIKSNGLIELKFDNNKLDQVEDFLSSFVLPQITSGNPVDTNKNDSNQNGHHLAQAPKLIEWGNEEDVHISKTSFRSFFAKCGGVAGKKEVGAHFHTFKIGEVNEGKFLAEIFHYDPTAAETTIELLVKMQLTPEMGKVSTAIKVLVPVGVDYIASFFKEDMADSFTRPIPNVGMSAGTCASTQIRNSPMVDACGAVFLALSSEHQKDFISKFCSHLVIPEETIREEIRKEERKRLRDLAVKNLESYIILEVGALLKKERGNATLETVDIQKLFE